MYRAAKRYAAVFLLLLTTALPLRAQMLGAEDITPVYDLVKTFKRIIPYHDTANHVTVFHVFMNTDYRYVKLFLRFDPDQTINAETQSQILYYLTHHDLWSLQPLADHTFDLRVELSIKDTPVSARYDYSTADLQNALAPSEQQWAHQFVSQVAQYLNNRVPIVVSDDGEAIVSCRFDSNALVLTNIYEYPDTVWPRIREYTGNNLDQVRRTVALNLLSDTSSGLVEALWAGGITLRHRYRDRFRTDSTEMNIAPWMWETFIDDIPLPDESDDSATITDTLALLYYISESVNKECPYPVDSLTTMVSCFFDSVNRVVTYTYTVDELTMLNLEGDAEAQNNLLEAIHLALSSDDGKELAVLLVATDATLVYQYSSPRSRSPLTFTLTADQIAALIH